MIVEDVQKSGPCVLLTGMEACTAAMETACQFLTK